MRRLMFPLAYSRRGLALLIDANAAVKRKGGLDAAANWKGSMTSLVM